MALPEQDCATLRQVLLKKSKKTKLLRGDGLVLRLCKEMDWTSDRVRAALQILRKEGELSASDWIRDEPTGQVHLALTPLPLTSEQQRWREALSVSDLTDSEREILEPLENYLGELDDAALQNFIRGLCELRREENIGESRYIVSARHLLGSSKMLDALPSVVLRAFGIYPEQFDDAAGYIMVAGPSSPSCVVLVENPQAMEVAIRLPELGDVAWVTTLGYGLSRMGNEYGNQLADLVASKRKRLHAVTRAGQPPSLEVLFNHTHLLFWGDLDQEGLRIYTRLRKSLPHLKLSAIYHALVKALKKGGHPYAAIFGKENQAQWFSDEPMLSNLLGICTKTSIDQESVDSNEIIRYARLNYDQVDAAYNSSTTLI